MADLLLICLGASIGAYIGAIAGPVRWHLVILVLLAIIVILL